MELCLQHESYRHCRCRRGDGLYQGTVLPFAARVLSWPQARLAQT